MSCQSNSGEPKYNFAAALHRILPPNSRPRKRVWPLVPLICAEQTRIGFLSKEKFSHPLFNLGSDRPLLCLYSKFIIRQHFSLENSSYRPISTTGDGNCLFNAASFLLCGNESLATELCLRTLIEMTNNKEFYLRMCRDFASFADYDEAILDCAKDGGYSCIWTICALSSVLGRPIVSVYPCVNGSDDIAYVSLNCTLQPRIHDYNDLEPLRIMWTRVQAGDSRDI